MLTVALATRNRGHLLSRCLDSMIDLTEPSGGWKLLIADDGSTDGTHSIIGRRADALPVEVVRLPAQGKNAALNALLPRLEGDLVVFCDDDILVPPDWLTRHRQLADLRPDFGVFGGAIAPAWESEPPAWILESVPLSVAYALTPDHFTEGGCPADRVWGGNMSVRTRFFAEGFRFDPAVGPDSGASGYRMGGETELVARLCRQGVRCFFSRAPQVRHIVRTSQFDEDWILARAFNYGRQVGARYRQEGGIRAFLRPSWWRLKANALSCIGIVGGRTKATTLRAGWARSFSRGVSYEARRE